MELSNQGKWLLGSSLLAIGAILFVIGWTAPFWPPWFGWLGFPVIKTLFPIVVMLVFGGVFMYGLILLSRTDPPPTSVTEINE
jgi:hypothetical protein